VSARRRWAKRQQGKDGKCPAGTHVDEGVVVRAGSWRGGGPTICDMKEHHRQFSPVVRERSLSRGTWGTAMNNCGKSDIDRGYVPDWM